MTVPQPAGTVTLVFTDIEGSTRLLEELGTDAYREVLAVHREVVRAACARHAGYEVDYEGDAFFYAFASAQAAIAAVSEAMVGLEGGPIRIRVGIHTGEPALDPPKYVGMDVHRAARIMSAAHGGQVVLSASTVAFLEPGSAELQELGQHRLKDLSSPVPLHQLVVAGLRAEFPPLKTLYRSNLPVPATPFLGREHELGEVVALLRDSATRLLTLTGPGGSGKTRLALQAAAETADSFLDGVTWLPLAPLRDPALLLPSLAHALGVAEQPDREPVEVLVEALEGKRLLLLLDNLEHLLPQAAVEVGRLVAGSPTMQVLVTSRERLQLQAEIAWPVPPLSADDGERLFVERARAVGAQLHVDSSLSELCRRLDQMPLALELAAARSVLFTPEQLLLRLSKRLDLLRGARDAEPRQQTLRATIDWSYQLLGPEEQRVFRALSAFAGGATIDAALELAGADPDTLQSLLDKSLLRRRDTPHGAARLWMLETIREYAAAQLVVSGEARDVRQRLVDLLVAFAEPPCGYPWSATPERTEQLEQELENLRAVFAELAATEDGDRARRLAVSMWPVWEMDGRLLEGDRWLAQSLALPGHSVVRRAEALDGRAALATYLNRPGEARALAAESVGLLREVGTSEQLSGALVTQSWAEATVDHDRAKALAEEAVALARSADTPHALRTAVYNLAYLEVQHGDVDRAARLFEEALALSLEAGEADFPGAMHQSIADLEFRRGNDAAAWNGFVAAAIEALRHGSRGVAVTCLAGLAAVAVRRGDRPLAQRLWASFESWQGEHGAPLQPGNRRAYEDALADLEPSAEPSIGLDEAVELARQHTPVLFGNAA
jgi:predicted ATPase/class 3 adenylate cyclase